MVTKRNKSTYESAMCLILAKIHMVTKPAGVVMFANTRLILAKIHMVTKHIPWHHLQLLSLILAKIHMVTKQGQQAAY